MKTKVLNILKKKQDCKFLLCDSNIFEAYSLHASHKPTDLKLLNFLPP